MARTLIDGGSKPIQNVLFLDSIFDALRAIVQHAGGPKVVGPKLYPAKSIDDARVALLNALNPDRPEKLDPEQVVMLLRIGREAEFHEAKHWLDAETGYTQSEPVDADDQAIALAQRLDHLLREVRAATGQLERVRKGAKR
jgi:hypothetical protein